jgi:hypothetical protein
LAACGRGKSKKKSKSSKSPGRKKKDVVAPVCSLVCVKVQLKAPVLLRTAEKNNGGLRPRKKKGKQKRPKSLEKPGANRPELSH